MNNVTLKQIITLLLMTAAMALILVMMPEQPVPADQAETGVSLVEQGRN